MKPLSKLHQKKIEKVKVLMFDLDGTFVGNNILKSSTYRSLEKLRLHGIKAVVVTGRPAGWCDLIAKWWPVDSVIGENGALSFGMLNGKMQREIFDTAISLEESNKLLDSLFKDIKSNYEGVHLTTDQPFRQWDMALDISEEYSMDMEEVKKIYDFCISKGANAAISNIHLNIWYGKYNKCAMALRILENWNMNIEECIYIGDSPNDAPMFKVFPLSVGVSSVKEYTDFMSDFPSYITNNDANQGFEELVNLILATK